MSFKDVLLALTSYPEPTPVSAIEDAVDLAVALGARISAVACEARMTTPGGVTAYLLKMPEIVAAELKKSTANARQLLDAFQDAAERRGVFQERLAPQCLTTEVPDVFTELARLRDLTMVPVPTGDFIDQWYAEAVIFGSGRPTIVLPQARSTSGPLKLDTVMVAWDMTRPAARAVADALPIIEKAARVHILTVTGEKELETPEAAGDLARYFMRRGLDAELHRIAIEGRRIGDVLESQAAICRADLLVMGACGHSRMREFMLGGATRRMLSRAPLPLLLSY